MPIAALFQPKSMTAAQYEEVLKRLEAEGALPMPGFISHVCFGTPNNLNVLDTWESQAQFDTFSQKLLPILKACGVDAGAPQVQPVHNIMPPRAT